MFFTHLIKWSTTVALGLLTLAMPVAVQADAIDQLKDQLSDQAQIQEKIYLHTDNESYFVSDTIWYKAYVLNADNLHPEALSKVLYVELLTPDGYLVERQRVIIDHHTQSHGQFYLPDSIYSGFYELRAYTRWQLNFNNKERKHSSDDDRWFYNSKLAKDYFTDYEGLYSRVLPIYERPLETGDYTDKRIIDRPKRRQDKEKRGMTMTFYPEGGSIIAGLDNRIAFEALDAYGKPMEIEGTLSDGTSFHTLADGRGIITCRPAEGQKPEAKVRYQDKTYTFDLPEVQKAGALIRYDAMTGQAQIIAHNTQIGAVAVSCRGHLVSFGRDACSIDASQLPTGVNEIVVYDPEARPLAVRQIFVNHNDRSQQLDVTLTTGNESTQKDFITAAPYQKVSLQSQLKEHAGLITVSVSVRDRRGDLPTYSDGNIMTDLLLAGDLRGFVAHPSYYFEADDEEHRQRLDLLLMVQGWRKYAPVSRLRFVHEKNFQMQGQIYKLNVNDVNEFDLLRLTESTNPSFTITSTGTIKDASEGSKMQIMDTEPATNPDETSTATNLAEFENLPEFEDQFFQNEKRDHKESIFKERVLVESELTKDKDVAGVIVDIDDEGKFAFNLPPFYDQAIMFLTAYAAKDSTNKALTSLKDKDRNNPMSCPDYYIRREYFYPKFTQPYTWYQTHTPEEDNEFEEAVDHVRDSLGMEHVLDNIVVKTRRRRVLHTFDRNKPAMVKDFAVVYNEAIDYGLHHGGFNGITFYEEASRTLFGNMNDPYRNIGIRATVDGHIFLRTYAYVSGENDLGESLGKPMTTAKLKDAIDPRHIWKLRIFTDFDMRNGVGKEENRSAPDVWFDIVPTPGSRTIRRDRRFVIDGFAYPDEFYHCDYSNHVPSIPNDYRRTLYWNANAHPDRDGNLQIQFYNGSRPSQMKVSICGVGTDGIIYYR